MAESTTIEEFGGHIVRETIGRQINDQDAFLLFVLFHNYQIELTGPVLSNRANLGAGSLLHADTQRGCSAILASLWAGTGDPRGDYMYWYRRWTSEWGGYTRQENLTGDEKKRLLELMQALEKHPFVRRFVVDDVDLLSK